MFDQLLEPFQNEDFSGADGLLRLAAYLFPFCVVLFFFVYEAFTGHSIKRRLKGILWQKKHTRKTKPRRSYTALLRKPKVIAIPLLLIALAFPLYDAYLTNTAQDGSLSCYRPYIIDGDTFTCNQTRIRLYSIDAPEMAGHCREGRKCVEGDPLKSKDYLISLTRGIVTCFPKDIDHYGRTVATCKSEQSEDLSCDMVKAGHAVLRYGNLNCTD